MNLKSVTALAGSLALAACSSSMPNNSPDQLPATRGQPSPDNAPENAIVIDREALKRSDDFLLYVMDKEVPSVRIAFDTGNTGNGCPRVSLRGPIVGDYQSNPRVYLNGTPLSDTCILMQLRSTEVAWMELYPSGSTRRAGYDVDPHGLILVFMRRI